MSFEYDVSAVTFSSLCQRTVKHGFERKRVFVALGKQFCGFSGPIVWELDGPRPILYNSVRLFIGYSLYRGYYSTPCVFINALRGIKVHKIAKYFAHTPSTICQAYKNVLILQGFIWT